MIPNQVRPQGPIIPGTPSGTVMLAAINTNDNNNVYVMVTSSSTTHNVEMVRALDDSGNLIPGISSLILRFVVTASGESLTFRATTGQYLSYNSAGTFTLQTTLPNPIFFDQANFQPIERPSVLLSGIQYLPYGDQTALVALRAYVGDSPVFLPLIPVPVNYYVSCSTDTGNDVVSDVAQVLRMIQCSYSTRTYCPSVPFAWTTQDLCFQGNQFTYCSAGTFCTGNCFSECQDPHQNCTLVSSMMYSCQSSVAETATPPVPTLPVVVTPIGSSDWFVFLVIFAIIFILLIFALIYYWADPDPVAITHTHHNATVVGAPITPVGTATPVGGWVGY